MADERRRRNRRIVQRTDWIDLVDEQIDFLRHSVANLLEDQIKWNGRLDELQKGSKINSNANNEISTISNQMYAHLEM